MQCKLLTVFFIKPGRYTYVYRLDKQSFSGPETRAVLITMECSAINHWSLSVVNLGPHKRCVATTHGNFLNGNKSHDFGPMHL